MSILNSWRHFPVIFLITYLFGWQTGTTVSLTIEAVQLEDYWQRRGTLKDYWFDDMALDLVFDLMGVLVGSQKEPLIRVFPTIKNKEYKLNVLIKL